MTNTEFINYIIKRLEKEGFSWSSEKELFEKILYPISKEDWEKSKSKWSSWNWRHRGDHSGIENLSKSRHILEAIAGNFKFKMDLWTESTRVQQTILDEVVKKSLKEKSEFILDVFEEEYIPPLTEIQEELYHRLQARSKEDIEKILLEYKYFFTKELENQNFLLKLLDLLYYKGSYNFLIKNVFSNLSLIFEEDDSILIKKSHILSSVKDVDYKEIALLLNKLSKKNPTQALKLQTAAVSNIIRDYTYNKSLSNEDLLDTLFKYIETYSNLYQIKKPFDYYPAIKLSYIHKILELSGFKKMSSNIEEIYKDVLPLIKEHKIKNNDDKYYASMSELEFFLLLNRVNTHIKIELLLEDLNPNRFLLERTVFQMQWFVETLETLDLKEYKILSDFQKAIDIIICYLDGK